MGAGSGSQAERQKGKKSKSQKVKKSKSQKARKSKRQNTQLCVREWTYSLSLWERVGVRAVRQWKPGAAKNGGISTAESRAAGV
jgi:hypothetical protein